MLETGIGGGASRTSLELESSPAGLISMVNSVSGTNNEEFGDRVNSFLHSVSAHVQFTLLREGDYKVDPHEIPGQNIISVEQVEERLSRLNPRKEMGPGRLPTWVPRDFVPLRAAPICAIFNASIGESVLLLYGHVLLSCLSSKQSPKNGRIGLMPNLTDSYPVQRAGIFCVPVAHGSSKRPAGPIPVWCNLWILDSACTGGPCA